MSCQSLKLDEFIAGYPFWGEWEVSYTDGTHLKENDYVKLGDITIDASEQTAQEHPILPFTFQPVTDKQIECRFSELPARREASRARKDIHPRSARRQSGQNWSFTP